MPSRRHLWLALAGAAILAVCLITAAELAYRHRASRRSSRSVPLRYYSNARYGRALVRGTDYGGMHINRWGLRGPEFDLEKEPGTIRVLVIGASTTFGSCVPSDSETWPARLEHWLGELDPARSFEVINAGLPSFPMEDQVIRLQTELYAFEPDVIVVYAGHGIVTASDAASVEPASRTPNATPTATPWGAWLRDHSALYARLVPVASGRAEPVPLDEAGWSRAVDNAADAFRRNLTSFALIARSLDAELVFVGLARVSGTRPPSEFSAAEMEAWRGLFGTPPEIVHEGYVRFDRIWRDVAQRTDASYLPPDSIGITGAESFCEGDPIHFNRTGSDAMGRRLAEQLLRRGVLHE